MITGIIKYSWAMGSYPSANPIWYPKKKAAQTINILRTSSI